MTDPEYTLDDLVAQTGFSRRQIRFYITKKLVPGAGDSRGPGATYPEETLQRLQAIARLKDLQIEPTGRTMTLDEIGHALDTLPPHGLDALASGAATPTVYDTDAPLACRKQPDEPLSPASEYLAGIAPRPTLMQARIFKTQSDTPEAELRDFLARIEALLADLGQDARHTAPRGADHWQRVSTDGLELNVRQPRNHPERLRLAGLARALGRILTDMEDPS